jgi:hypothetical protein
MTAWFCKRCDCFGSGPECWVCRKSDELILDFSWHGDMQDPEPWPIDFQVPR